MKLLFIRHGQTYMNQERRFSGMHSDTGLTEVGKKQSIAVAQYIYRNYNNVDAIYSSPLKRAYDTAQYLYNLYEKKHNINIDNDLSEVDFGNWEGLILDNILLKWPKEVEQWRYDIDNFRFNGGESMINFKNRVIGWLNKLIIDYIKYKTIVIYTHSTPIRIVLSYILQSPMNSLFKIDILNANVTSIDYNDSITHKWVINYVNKI